MIFGSWHVTSTANNNCKRQEHCVTARFALGEIVCYFLCTQSRICFFTAKPVERQTLIKILPHKHTKNQRIWLFQLTFHQTTNAIHTSFNRIQIKNNNNESLEVQRLANTPKTLTLFCDGNRNCSTQTRPNLFSLLRKDDKI